MSFSPSQKKKEERKKKNSWKLIHVTRSSKFTLQTFCVEVIEFCFTCQHWGIPELLMGLHKPVHLWPASHRNKVSALTSVAQPTTQASPLSPLSLFRRIESFLPRKVWDSGHRTSGCSYTGWWLPLGMACFLSVAAEPSLGVWSTCVLWGFCLPVVLAALWDLVRPVKCLSETDETLLCTEAFLRADHILEKIYVFYPCISQNVKRDIKF